MLLNTRSAHLQHSVQAGLRRLRTCPSPVVSRSRYQLSYQQAQDVLDGRPPAQGQEVAAADREQLQRALTTLKGVTDSLRARRQAVRTASEMHGTGRSTSPSVSGGTQ